MSNDPVVSVFNAANIVGIISAAMAIISAILSYLSYRKSSDEYGKNKKDNFVTTINQSLDVVYTELSEFIELFTDKRDTKEKRIVRDRIVYSLESIRVNFNNSTYTDTVIDEKFGDISVKISDTTYERNFEKSMHDLAQIKGCISNLKNSLII
jgi:hypothetical protein